MNGVAASPKAGKKVPRIRRLPPGGQILEVWTALFLQQRGLWEEVGIPAPFAGITPSFFSSLLYLISGDVRWNKLNLACICKCTHIHTHTQVCRHRHTLGRRGVPRSKGKLGLYSLWFQPKGLLLSVWPWTKPLWVPDCLKVSSPVVVTVVVVRARLLWGSEH